VISATATDVGMPRLTDSMTEGTILRWLKSPGDPVAVGDELLEVETDKATTVYESDVAGTLLETLADEGATVPVGGLIARIGEPDEAPATNRAVTASPVARRLAAELGVDLASLRGSGPGGRIVKADIEAAASAASGVSASTAPAPDRAASATPGSGKGRPRIVTPSPAQHRVARRMVESITRVPQFHMTVEIDMSRAAEARARLRETASEAERIPTFNDMVIRAAALGLRARPRANASWTDRGIEIYPRVNVGFAVATDEALLVPTIVDADRKGLADIAAETAALAERARDGTISAAEMADGTFTVTNLGMYGIDELDAIINPPQAAILAVGAVAERSVARNGRSTVAPMVRATLGCDHRVLNGADGAALLADIRRLLEEPIRLAG